MRKTLVLVGLLAVVAFATDRAWGTLTGSCEVHLCADGKVFCFQFPGNKDTLGGAAGASHQMCQLELVDAPCSEIPECGRRVPAVGAAGFAILGMTMGIAGVLFARRRRRLVSA